jgi:hypothetical protein
MRLGNANASGIWGPDSLLGNPFTPDSQHLLVSIADLTETLIQRKIRVLSQGVDSWTCVWCGVSLGGWAKAHHHSLPLSTALHPPVLRIYGPIIRTIR